MSILGILSILRFGAWRVRCGMSRLGKHFVYRVIVGVLGC